MTADLVAFVRQCLTDDEKLAWDLVEARMRSGQQEPRGSGHPRTYNPGDILNEIHAKRLIISLYEEAVETVAMFKEHGHSGSHHEVAAESYLNVIRLHAYAYRAREGYRAEPEWAPAWILERSQ